MRSIVKAILKILLLFAIAFALTLAVLKWTGRSRDAATALTSAEIDDAQLAVERLQIEARGGEVRLGEADLRGLLVASLAGSKNGRAVLENSLDVRASVLGERIEVGVVIAAADVSQKLRGLGDEKLDRLASIVGLLPGDGMFLGVRGVPIVRDGKLSLDTSSLDLQLGPLTVSSKDLAEKVGLTSGRIAEELLLGVDGVVFEDVRVEDEALVFETRPVG